MENGWKALWLKKKGCQGLPRCDSGLSWCFKQASMWNLVLIFPSIIEIPRGGVDCRDCQETWYSWTAWEFQDHWDYLNILIMINGICVKNVISSQAIQKSKWTQRSKVYCECCNYQCNPMQLKKWHLEKNIWLRFTIGVKPAQCFFWKAQGTRMSEMICGVLNHANTKHKYTNTVYKNTVNDEMFINPIKC